MIPILNAKMKENIKAVENIILSEINVKSIEYLTAESKVLTKKINPNFKTLGPKYGKDMKVITDAIMQFTSDDIEKIEKDGSFPISENICIDLIDVEISLADIPGCIVSSNDEITVALDVTLSKKLKEEGLAREFINRIQNLRKDKGFKVTDKINILVEKNEALSSAIQNNFIYICDETLASELKLIDKLDNAEEKIELVDEISTKVSVKKQ